MLQHLLALREALARGETPDAFGICIYVAGQAGKTVRQVSTVLKPRWTNWPELRADLLLDWPVAGSRISNSYERDQTLGASKSSGEPITFWHEAGEADPQRRWANPRRLSLLDHLIKEYEHETDL